MAMTQYPIEDGGTNPIYVWPIFQAYFLGNIPRKYGQNYATVAPFQDPEIPIEPWYPMRSQQRGVK